MGNTNFVRAKSLQRDEFYTQFSDIESEMRLYTDYFKGKTVYCNCDDPNLSSFYAYFYANFKSLQLQKLITTHIAGNALAYKREVTTALGIVDTKLNGTGDFASEECRKILATCDIVVTNPPFSLFKEYIAVILEAKKLFLCIGSIGSIGYKNIFAAFFAGHLWTGSARLKTFQTASGETVGAPARWFTNMKPCYDKPFLPLTAVYKGNESAYHIYDNYDAVNVDRLKDIPNDYMGNMGVPVTFVDKYNPEQFTIVGVDSALTLERNGKSSCFYIDGRRIYYRIVIKRREKACASK